MQSPKRYLETISNDNEYDLPDPKSPGEFADRFGIRASLLILCVGARRRLAEKNKLNTDDARHVEEIFRAKLLSFAIHHADGLSQSDDDQGDEAGWWKLLALIQPLRPAPCGSKRIPWLPNRATELAAEIRKHVPEFEIDYHVDPVRQDRRYPAALARCERCKAGLGFLTAV
jgi:hypothetical protein